MPAFEKKSIGFAGLFWFVLTALFFVALFSFVFLYPEYSKAFYVLVAAIGLYVTVVYVLADRNVAVVVPPKLEKFPSLTVLIPSFNAASTLENCLKHVLALKYPRKFSVAVIDDGSTDRTSEVLKRFPKVKVLGGGKNRGKAVQLNRAIRACKTDLIACVDSDTYPNPQVLLDSVPLFYSRPNVGAVTLFITVANPKNFIQQVQNVEYFSGFGFYSKVAADLDGLYVAPGPMTVFSRKALVAINGFDEDNLTEDMEIALRLHSHGFSLAYAPSAVPTEVPDTLKGLYKQRLRWYRGTIHNVLKYKHMFFNAKFNEFGKFFFPALSVFVATILLAFAVIWGLIFFGIFQWLAKLYYSFSVGHFPLFAFWENFTVNSLLVFAAVAVVLWYVFFRKSVSMLRYNASHLVLPALATIFVYPIFISLVYTISLFKELKASGRAW